MRYQITVSSSTAPLPESTSIIVTLNNGTTTNILSTSSSTTVSYGGWQYVSVSAPTTAYNGYYVDWTVTSGTGAVRVSTSSNTSYGTSATTTISSRSTGIYVYGYSTGIAYLTATLRSTANGTALDTLRIPITVGTSGFTLSPSPSNTSTVYLYDNYYNDYYYDYNYDYYYRNYREFSVTPYYNGSSILNSSLYDITYTWSVNSSTQSNSNNRYFTLYSSNSSLYSSSRSNTLTCRATFYNRGSNTIIDTASVSWTVYTDYTYNDYTVSATVYDTSSYTLTDRDDKGATSIVSQLESKLNSNESISYVRFSSVSSTYGSLNASTSRDYYYSSSSSNYDLRDVVFTPSRVGTATFGCTVYGTRGTVYSCTIRITVEAGTSSTSNITYSARAGSSVAFDAGDFEDWWQDRYSRGTLSYVRFTSASGGTLYANYNGSTGTSVVSSSGGTSCYARPTSRQTGIDDLTFVPSNSSNTSATIRFTAYGTTSSSSTQTSSVSGTVSITYTNASVAAITYTTTGTKSVTLSASDFTTRYRDVIGSTTSSLTIRFRSVPSNGTLAIGNTTLTSSNISSYNFSSSSSGSNRISDVTYTPKSNSNSSDTVNYDCYTGSTLRFSGTITFTNRAESTVTTGVTVSYSTTGANVTFNAADFYNKNSAMLSASYLVFSSPSSGSLYVGSTPVATGTQFAYVSNPSASYQNLGSLTYRPAAGFNGTATISFTAYNSNGSAAATGTVSILVSQSTTTVTPVSTFGDVASTAWYYTDVTTLAQANIINGRNDGLFHPNDAVNYGEALKLILLSAGYPLQTEGTGSAWAQNYLNLAISEGLLPGSASDYNLSANMNRTTVATVAAKALKLTPVTGEASPYADTTDGYVLALTKTGIVQGDASSGTQLWMGADNLTRAQVARIVYNVYKYRNVNVGTTGSNSTIDTNKPSWLN